MHRLALPLSASSLVLAVPAAAQTAADQGVVESRYHLVMLTQTFDGVRERSQSQKAGFARVRKGDESWIRIDFGDGAQVIRQNGQLRVGRFENRSDAEVALAYDYRTHKLRGNSATSSYLNTYVAPLLGKAPPLGSDATWQVAVTPAALGLTGVQGGAVTLEMSRRAVSYNGQSYILLEYRIPVFTYTDAAGEPVTQWGEGAALASPDLGTIYWNATLQRATALGADGKPRAYRYARSGFAAEPTGKPMLSVVSLPGMKPVLDRFYAPTATAALPAAAMTEKPDQTPLKLAALIDVAAFAVAEDSPNQLAESVGSYVLGETGRNAGAAIDKALASAGSSIAAGIQEYGAPITPATINSLTSQPWAGGGTTRAANLTQATQAERWMLANGITPANLTTMAQKAEQLAKQGESLQVEMTALRREYQLVRGAIEANNLAFAQALVANADKGVKGAASVVTSLPVSQLQTMEARSAALIKSIAGVNAEIKVNAQAATDAAQFASGLTKAAPVVQSLGLGTIAKQMVDVAAKYKVAEKLSVLNNIVNVAVITESAWKAITFDPAKPQLNLVNNDYDSYAAMGASVFLNGVAIGKDVLTGNGKQLALDVAGFAAGRFTDLYISARGALAAQDQAAYARNELFLTELKASTKRMAKVQAEIDGFYADNSRLGKDMKAFEQQLATERANRGPNNIDDPNWQDPRYDAKTGLPIPEYWQWLKANDPQALVRLGIDPSAPVGTPPGTTPTQVVQRDTKPQVINPRQPEAPDYPTYKPKPKPDKPETATPDTPVPDTDPVATNEPAATDDTSATPPPPKPPRQPVRDTRNDPLRNSIDDPVISSEGTAQLGVTPLDVSPLDVTPVTFTPVEFEPVTWEPVTWDPPTWVPPTFEAPKPSEIPWTDFGDKEDWGNDINNLAYQYGDLSGTVATDLSPWAEWLKTQNIRELEQMALSAGYPNLASALKDAENLIRMAHDTGFRQWAYAIPVGSGSIGIWASEAQHNLARSQIALGDLLAASRGIFSTGGFTDIGISSFNLAYILRDTGVQDGDRININLSQFGRTVFDGELSLLNAGTRLENQLGRGVAQLVITALNEGSLPPNTAGIELQNVVRGTGTQNYSLTTGQTATLRIEANAQAGGR